MLGLERWNQDWAIVEADAARIDEFVAFFEKRADLTPWAGELLFELVLASISEALEQGKLDRKGLARYEPFIRTVGPRYPDALRRWAAMPCEPCRPWKVSQWLQATFRL